MSLDMKALKEAAEKAHLKWLSDEYPFTAYTPFCYYRVSPVNDDTGPHWEVQIRYNGSTYMRRETELEAKASAQADYAERLETALANPSTILSLIERCEAMEGALRYAAMGLGRIHDSLTTLAPKQAVGEMTQHFRDVAEAALSKADATS